jgi:hypothetical protein
MAVNTRKEPGRGPGRTAGGGIAMAADVLVIPLTHAVVSKTTGSDAEALTLDDGVPGQLLTIILTTDGGGAGTITPARKTGWATAVLDEAGDVFTFKYIDNSLGWVVIGCAGVAACPVISV